MKSFSLLYLVILSIFFSLDVIAADETIRCGSKIVKLGMKTDEVRKHCGEPTSIETVEHDVRSGNRVTGTTFENIWIYRRGSGKPARLHFDIDKLMAIKYE